MQALSYVAKGKPNRRFVLVTPDGTCGAVVETRRTTFVYRTPPPTAASSSSRSPASSGLHQILDLSSCAWSSAAAADHADSPVLGARLVTCNDSPPGGACTLVLLVQGAVVTQGIRDVLHA